MPATPLAALGDITARYGTLNTQQTAAANYLLLAASYTIAQATGKPLASLETLDTDTTELLRIVCVELVTRALENPTGAAAFREALGQYSYATNYRDVADGGGLFLTKNEELLVRKAVHGQLTASPRVQGLETDITGGPYVLGT